MKNTVKFLVLSFFAFSCASTEKVNWETKAHDPEFVHRAVKQVTDVIVHDIFSPPVASRIYAYMSIAGYEVAIHGDAKYASLAGQVNGLEGVPQPEAGQQYCFPLATAQAILKVGRTLVFSEDKMDAFYNNMMQEFKDAGIPKDVFERSVAYGTAVADHVIAWSGKDNYKQSRSFPKYSIEDSPATWKPTPPAYMDAVEPHWNKIRPFAIDSARQFMPAPPTSFSIDRKSQFFKEADEVYQMGKGLTDEQRQIASFWDCNPFVMNVKGHVMFATKKISPGGHWMNITRVACKQVNASYVQATEAYALVAISLVDGFISCWDEKYRSRVIRPETYINQYIDEDWTPLLQTPPFPEYTSGHSVISGASAITLTSLFGENFAFTDSTEIEFGLSVRSFKSFEQAAEEAAISRMYGGIHYRPAVQNGMLEGRALGNYIVRKLKTRRKELADAH
ncbi:vanadium-dependent haloperoxidase [Fulvivirgaceae bacterium PWU4]|uniref:Vanadium-dependent haloperoxidase n=1 Tax=Chryseosolibacter histidini TaxID=2782349 RepID=A0AAP2DK76_9BACT|nr:vanadium-dependent haloperoxidase [Chryseosolibacter histidini]MBT1696868.1 vanadium-dependent haloperoxidase [Chryseosolibacter histidini]